ncbi:VanZ family protein [Euzebyella saccharophila]|uniref:VanZ family protein n=1 Tax=Euzebyella saccharophila TaxID=679664 RepID=A0ABV8JSY9_9FLAO|nr:VanZ family protein [Euzebyella saccharophila]
MLKKNKYKIAFISWMVFVTYSSLSSFEGVDTPGLNIPHLDKAVHFTFYFVASFLGVFCLREFSGRAISKKKVFLIAVLFAIAFGIIIEVLQYALTTDRQGDVWDAFANSIGALAGIMAVKFLFSGNSRLKWEI